MKALLRKIRQILRDRRTRRFLTRFVSGVAAIVVFVTTYALVLPAITMESEATCGIEAHQHDDSCYSEKLICGQEESEGHHHTEDCYTVTKELECQIQEHQHSSENGCFDEEGNLVCKLEEHTHSDSCYKEHRELTCGLEESEGHHHTDSCYTKVLTCGKEVHTHSAACYKADLQIEAAAVASTGMTSAAAVPELSEEDIYSEEPERSQNDAATNEAPDEQEQADADKEHADDVLASEDDSEDETRDDTAADIRNDEKDKGSSEEGEEAASSFSTGFAADEAAENGDAYIPEKDELDFKAVLNGRTGIYYHHVEVDEDIEDSSAITDWTRADDDSELSSADIIRMYLSYTLPKDAVNATNDIARYRLPDSLHLTDEQIDAINACENGISSQYINYDSLEITDNDRHAAYLGLESVEGTRLPGEELNGDAQEYISATVRAEKIYDEDSGEYLGTDLIITFSPYTVEKNAHAYDKDGQPTRAGEKVTGWIALDFNMSQIDWEEDNTSEIIFAEEDKEDKISEIKTVLRQADPSDAEADDSAAAGTTDAAAEYATGEIAAEDMTAGAAATDAAEETAAEDMTAENTAADATEEAAKAAATETAAEDSTADAAAGNTADTTDEDDKTQEITAANYPAAVFDDSITVRSGRLDTDLDDTKLPRKTKMTVHVEADEGTFPEGTRMVLSPVEDLNAVAEAVGTAIDAKTRGFQAVDITFYDKDPAEEGAKEIEPLKPIRVSIKSDEIKKAAEDASTAPVVVHIEDDNTATEIENTASKTDNATIEIEKPGVEAEPSDMGKDNADAENKGLQEGSADTETDHNIPEQDKNNIESDPENTGDDSSVDSTDVQDNHSDNNIGAGEEDKPAATDVDSMDSPAENTGSADENASEAATGLNDGGSDNAVNFEADSFSVYAIVYTVDFEYTDPASGQVYSYSLEGGQIISLKELLVALGIKNEEEIETFIEKDIKDVQFSTPDLVRIEKVTEGVLVKQTKDWTVTPLKPFDTEEALTITDSEDGQIVISLSAHGLEEVSNDLVTIRPMGGILPEDAEANAEQLAGKDTETARKAATDFEEKGILKKIAGLFSGDNDSKKGKVYDVFEIGLSNVETDHYDGFTVDVTLPENVTGKDFTLYHLHDDKLEKVDVELKAEETEQGTQKVSGFSFETTGFSQFVLSYTVDFHWEVDGQMYNYSIQGGQTLSLKKLLTILNIIPEEEVQEFVDDISTVEFTNPELVHVEKVEEDTTAGSLKEKLQLEPEYSSSLTEEDIAEMDALQLTAVDWALISLKAFDTEEWLTITLNDGEVLLIKVTDARDPLGLDDRTFSVVSTRNGGNNDTKKYSVKLGTKSGTAGGTSVTAIDAAETAVSADYKYSRETDTAWLFEYDPDTHGYYMSQYGSGTYLVMNPDTQAKNDGTVAVSLTNESGKTPVYVSKNYTEAFDEETGKYTYTWDGTYRISNKPLVETFDTATNKRTTNEADLMFLWNYGGSFWVDKVGTDPDGNQNAVMHFCLPELDPNNNDQHSGSHKATLTSVQNLQPGQSVVIYQRVKQTDNTFKSYAIADNEDITDGSAELVRVWNSSDSVYWKNDPAILWTFKEATNPDGTPNGYYFFVNEQTGRYLAAKADGTIIQDLDSSNFDDLSKVNMREDHVQIDLPGRRSDSAYTSKIANWDYNRSYTSAPKVNDTNKDGTPESVSSESLNDSQEFYFAVLDPIVQKQLTEVDTVDNDDHGITMTMYDFSQNNINQNRLPYMSSVIGSDGWAPGVYTPGLVSNTLVQNADGTYSDWPTTAAGNSLGNIFTSNNSENYKVDSWDANHLFLQNVYDSTGYFRYSAFENFARFNTNTGDFAVYEQIGVPATSNSYDQDWEQYYKKRGNFMPFDDLDLSVTPRQNEIRPEDNHALDNEDPRKYEDLYRMYSTRNYFFGMVMDAKFQQDKDGYNSHGDPVRYDFNGDDDMWIYIDGVLILDIGGVHDAFHGYIDFTDGTIHVDNTQNVADTTIREQFFKAHRYPDGTEWPEADGLYSEKSNDFFRGNTFADYSSHKFKMIYMERGAGASNLEMQFNLTTLKQDMFKVTKDMPETMTGHTMQEIYGNATFFYKAYKVTKDPATGEETITTIKKTDSFQNDKGETKTYEETATYEDGKTPLIWREDGETFELKPGHTAFIPVEHYGVRYYVEEVEPEPNVTNMLDNYEVYNNSPEAGQPENKQLLTDVKTVQQRAEVIYKNKPADGLVNELRITKNLHGKMLKDADGNYIEVGVGSPYFEYVVYLEDNNGKMVPYSLGEYYIIDKYGRFVYYTKETHVRHYYGFAKNADGTYSYYEVSPAIEGEGSDAAPELGNLVETTKNPKITEQFGAEGYVGDIRDGDTLVIVGLLEGTHFVVDEITTGSGITTSEKDEGYIGSTKYLYEDTDVNYVYVNGEDIPDDVNPSGNMFNIPTNIDEIREGLNKHDNGDQIAAEGDIKMDQDTEVTVHNRSKANTIPILVKKNWTGIDANDIALKDAKIKVTLGRYVLKDKAGTLTIKKTGVPDGVNFTATYNVKDSHNNTVAVVQYSPKFKDGVTISVPPGTYTVTENVKNEDSGYVWNHTGSPASGIEITDDGSGEATFTCSPRLKTGNLNVTSSYTAPAEATIDFSNVTYTVYAGDENSTTRATFPNGELVPIITYQQAKDGYTVQGLRAGTYTVKEEGVPNDSSDGGYTLTDHTSVVTKNVIDGQTAEAEFNSVYTKNATPATIIVRWQEHWGNHNYRELLRSEGEYNVGDTVQLSFYRQTHNNVMQLYINNQQVNLPVGSYESGTPKLETRNFTIDSETVIIDFRNDTWGDMDPNSGRTPSLSLVTRAKAASHSRSLARMAPQRAGDDEGNSELPAGASSPAQVIDYGTTPEAPAGKKYVEDTTFKMDDPENEGEKIDYTVVLTQKEINSVILDGKAAWTWDSLTAKADLPATDEDGNIYYYYIKSVEEEDLGLYTNTTVKLDDSDTFLVGKDKHFNTETNTPEALEVNNEIVRVDLDVEKVWAPAGTNPPTGAEATVELYYAKRAMTNAEGQQIPEEDRAAWPTDVSDCSPVAGASELAGAGISTTEIVLSADSSPTAWKGSFHNLPKAIVGSDGLIYEVRYYAGEISLLVPGDGKTVIDETAINVINQYTQSYTRTEPQGAAAATSDGTVKITNTREKVQVTVQKEWDPVPNDPNASVTVELRRYAKMSKGTLGVVLKDNSGAAIQGAVYKLYSQTNGNWAETETTATTDVNGRAIVSGLEPGTYKLVQISTPSAYAMSKSGASDNFNYITESDVLTVVGSTLEKQVKWTDNANKRKVTAGVATLTVTGTAKVYDSETQTWGMSPAAPVEGATVTLYKDNAVYTAAQGLVTDANGQVVVSGLPAGEYYFLLDEVTDDYTLPATDNERKSERFIIIENPGAEQTAEVSIEDVNAASRGIVTVTLKREDNNALVEGATFTLTGNGQTLTATTGSDGVATFGSLENKLNAGTYTIHQVDTAEGLKPSTSDQTITIDDWAEYDNNQTVAVEFTNILQGKGTVTVTITKEDTNEPVSNATVQLKQAGEVVHTGTTDGNGVVTFDNLPEGTYVVHQHNAGDADSDYDTAADPRPFTVVEGNAGQEFTYSLENERKTGYATIKVWKKQGRGSNEPWNWTLVNTYPNLKTGKTYSFTASAAKNLYSNDNNNTNDHLWYYDDNRDHQNGDYLDQNRIQNLNGANWNDGSYTFTFTPTADGATYSIVIITDWGADNIYSISKDADGTANANEKPANTMADTALVPNLLSSRLPETVTMAAADSKPLVGGVSLRDADNRQVRAIADAQPTPLPVDIADQYMEDTSFEGQTYPITSEDPNWSHAFDPEDKYDADGNLYYYYVVETDHTPDTAAGYYISNYDGDPRSETGEITITNTQEKGGLTITKAVTVDDGDVPATAQTIADGTYTFRITGPSYPQGHEETITVTNGQAEGSIVLNSLYAGNYTIAETGSTNPNGITLAADQTVTVAPGTQASANVAAFTNNLETTHITANKVWTDSNDVDHSGDSITYQILRIPYATENDSDHPGQTIRVEYPAETVTAELVPSMTGFTGSLSADNEPAWSETVTNLPKSGWLELQDSTRIAVSYEYYIKEGEFNGYTSAISGGEDSQTEAYAFTITNEPMSPTDTETQVDIKKDWKNSDGTADNSLHSGDSIVFRLSQKRYEAKITYTYNGNSITSPLYPVTINLFNADGEKSNLSKVVYIPEGVGLTITPQTSNQGHRVRGTGFDSPTNNRGYASGQQFVINSVGSAEEVSLRLEHTGETWSNQAGSGKWSFTLSNAQNVILSKGDILGSLSRSDDPVITNLDYTMTLDTEENKAVITPGTNVPGQGSGTGVWQGSVLNLPFYKYDTSNNKYYVYEYEVSEIRINTETVQLLDDEDFDGETSAYYVNWSQNTQTGLWTITNQKKPSISVSIHKVDRDNLDAGTPLLPGAKFQLVKYTKISPVKEKDMSWGTEGVSDEVSEAPGNPGIFNFQGLEAGYYEIVETKYPDGYIKAHENPIFQVRSNATTHAMEAVLVHASGENIGQPVDGNKIDGVVKIDNTTITFGNAPGAALPESGGPGTGMFTILGSVLLAFAGILLIRRRRSI